jgi:TonB family protein
VYDDLARTQRPGVLEQLVVRWLIPSLLTSFVLQCRAMNGSNDRLQFEGVFTHCFIGGVDMRAISSAASISIHAAVAAALLLGTTKSARTSDIVIASPPIPPLVFGESTDGRAEPGPGVGAPVPDGSQLDLGSLPLPGDAFLREGLIRSLVPSEWAPRAGVPSGGPDGSGVAFGNAAPEVLSGPIPVYPELLRQAGVEGQVVLEARVDSTGRVQRASIAVVSTTHQGFVEPARQALLATLFRPAQVNGRSVSILVRVPFAFSIRGGTGRAR